MKINGCSLKACSCKSDYQDKKYGKGLRVWTNGPKRDTCTVCKAAVTKS